MTRVDVRELPGGGDDERVVRPYPGTGEHEPACAQDGDRGLPGGDAGKCGDLVEDLLLQVDGRVHAALLLRDLGADLRRVAGAGGEDPVGEPGPRCRPGGGGAAAGEERQALGEPAADRGEGVRGDAVTAGVPDRNRGGAGLPGQVLPGPVEELARDDGVLLALHDDDRDAGKARGGGGDAGVERQRSVEDRRTGVPGGVVEQEPVGERRAAAEPNQDNRPAGRCDSVKPAAEPVHRLAQRRRDRAPDAAIGEPRVPAALGDRRPDRRVRGPGGQVLGEAGDVAFVRAAPVQQDDQGRRRVRGPGSGDDGVGKARHALVGSATIWPAVRTPDHRSISAWRSSRSMGAAFSYSPQASRGSIHMISNSLLSGSAP